MAIGLHSVCLKLNSNQNYVYSFLKRKKLIYPLNNFLNKNFFSKYLINCINDKVSFDSPYNIHGKEKVLKKLRV